MAEITEEQTTITFSMKNEKVNEIHKIFLDVYSALRERGHNPVHQITGYILTEDPTYITNYKNARSNIRKIDRYDLINIMIKTYLNYLTV